ncbi:glutamate-1-semialdehyde aminotransferase [Ferroacidibacillus organovorans]|uniref:Glutamate-1-semialdehyde 2,1-aminomutase n=2 Tax=Ferroacidibacillus organovorans TaxID=1765683 RepID=A0A853KAU8_9BACL|nr:glutamate-1-semialdehyde aminotransferase [Ferroacidibacillus organovorans]OAG93977.1 glutamate-1-semialdehyde aminotransferase [Ferroacidibacillus organovorans]
MTRRTARSAEAMKRAQTLIPGGVNSPVRAFRAVGGTPRFMTRGEGPYLYDLDGNRYIDYVLSWGPLILGHAHQAVVQAITEQTVRGTSYGAPTELESDLAALILSALPSMDLVRMVNSGTEATMSALRLARGFTGRSKIIKFIGCYHGHADSLLIRAGSGVATFSLPDSPGVPPEIAALTISLPYNDLAAVESAFAQFGEEIAAIIVEPVGGNMGMVPPKDGFLQGLRAVTQSYGALLIFDEVMTGFRVRFGGAQGYYGVKPDLTTLGKVIGGGLPVGAYGGRKDIMDLVAPAGPVYQAGTLSGNPLAVAAGLATLKTLATEGVYEGLEARSAQLVSTFLDAGKRYGFPVQGTFLGGMFGCFFAEHPVTDYESAAQSDKARYASYFHALLDRSVYLAPSHLEAGFVSLVHDDVALAETCEAIDSAMRAIH